jgi:hypothetical protein
MVSLAILAASSGPISSATQESVAENEGGSREYLRRVGEKWVRVTRRADGTFRSQGPAAPPAFSSAAAEPAPVSAGTESAVPLRPYITYPTSSWPEAVAIGDLNGDGRNDIAMVTSYYFDAANDYHLHVWTQKADGTLAPRVKYPLGGNPQSVAVGDVTGDGLADVVVGISSAVGVLKQNAQGTLDAMTPYASTASRYVRVADLNSDGRLDVVAMTWGMGTVSVFSQTPEGTLGTPVVYSAPHDGYDDLEVGDVDHDGRTDVVVMSGQGSAANFSVLYQQADGTLGGLASRAIGTSRLAGGIGVGDVNSDTRADIVVAMNWAGGGTPEIDVFRQGADGTLPASPTQTAATGGYPEPLEVGDVTTDGRADVVVFQGNIAVFAQSPEGTLLPYEVLPFPYATHLNRHGIAIGDVSGDGTNDVVVANYNYGLVVYLSKGPEITVSVPTPVVVGVERTVRWTATGGAFSTFAVSYSVDGGSSYTPVPGCEALAGPATSCSWASPGPVTSTGRVRVVGRDASGAILATGEAAIAIVAPVLTLTAPNTAVVWPAGATRAISWTSSMGAQETVSIELSRDGGATWTVLGLAANTGLYQWTVTNPTTSAARARVVWTRATSVFDASDASFTIDRPPVAAAGPDVSAELGTPTLLSALGSSDPDGDPLSYIWLGPEGIIGTGATVSVTPPVGSTTYTLTVADPYGLWSSDSVSVSVEDTTPPVVVVVSPIAGKTLPPARAALVKWTAADNGSIAYFDVFVSRDSGVTYTPVPECTHLPSSARSCPWTPGRTTAGIAVIRVVGRDPAGNGGAGGASYSVRAGR